MVDKEIIEPDYKNIIENTTDYAIMTLDLERRITSWNSGAEKIMGWSREEALGRSGDMIFPVEDRPHVPEEDVRLVREQGSAEDARWHIRKDGSLFWANGRMMPLIREGQLIGFIRILLDQTSKKQIEQALQSMNEALERKVEERTRELLESRNRLRQLITQLSKTEEREKTRLANDLHDNLGQILAVCRMELELTQIEAPDCAAAGNVGKALELMDEAIRYTREFMSDLKPPQEINQRNLVGMVEWLAQRKRKYGLTVRVEDDRAPKPLKEDVRRVIFQLVRELLFNVIKHAKVKEATVELARTDDQVEIRVIDRGRGFDPVIETEKTKYKGFGIFGMQEQLKLVGGSIKITSSPGTGTRAVIRVPISE